MLLRPGLKLNSVVSDVQVVVVRAPSTEVVVSCGGAAMAVDRSGAVAGVPAPPPGETTLLGKRYVDDGIGLEVLCCRAGDGALTVDGNALVVKGAKPLPASD